MRHAASLLWILVFSKLRAPGFGSQKWRSSILAYSEIFSLSLDSCENGPITCTGPTGSTGPTGPYGPYGPLRALYGPHTGTYGPLATVQN